MKTIRNVLTALVGLLFTLSLVAAPSAQADVRDQSAVAWDAVTGEALAAWDCPEGYVCFWTGGAGGGSRCAWEGDEDDWRDICSWAGQNVRSIFNNGRSTAFTGVAYYRNADYVGRAGCVKRGTRASILGVRVLSHRWITTAC